MIFDPNMLSALNHADSFMVCTHVRPDGDAIGSLLAMGRLLKALGKQVTLVSQDGVPAKFLQLFDDAATVKAPDQVQDKQFDAAVAVDVSEEARMGDDVVLIFRAANVSMQVDHHGTNPLFAMYNAVDSSCPATGELMVMLFDALNVHIDAETAAMLYCAISTDSGNFTFNGVRGSTFACMQKLMDSGLDLAVLSRKLFKVRAPQAVKLLGCALKSLTFFADGQATYMFVTQEDIRAANAEPEHLGGIVNAGLDIEGVKMAFMGDECADGTWKCSLRAVPGYNVAEIARLFGGGGHALAAGCTITEPFDIAKEKIMAAMIEKLRA